VADCGAKSAVSGLVGSVGTLSQGWRLHEKQLVGSDAILDVEPGIVIDGKFIHKTMHSKLS
jgi:hypothetical protein